MADNTIYMKEKDSYPKDKKPYHELVTRVYFSGRPETAKTARLKMSKPLVKKVEGPFDEENKLIETTEVGKTYIFKATEFEKSTLSPIKNIWWAEQIDEGEICDLETNKDNLYLDDDKNVCFKYKIETEKPIRIYAYGSKPLEEISVLVNKVIKETILIVGTEQHSTNSANKLMFPAQAVREVRENFSDTPVLEVLIFKDGYTENQLKAFSNAVLFFNKEARIIEINEVEELINFINEGTTNSNKNSTYRNSRKISEIKVFAHGYVRDKTNEGVIAFGLDGKNANKQELDNKVFNKIDKNVFLTNNESHFYSYACRTGIGVSSEIVNDPLKSNSLAQKISNHSQIIVHAYMKRSLYADTWGTQNHRDTYISDNDKGESFIENLKTDIKDMIADDPNDMNSFALYIATEKNIDGAIWNTQGAYLPVKAGDYPKGIPNSYETYKPE